MPKSSEDATNLMADLASPMSAFVRERCTREPGAEVCRDDLYDAWKQWAEDNGHREQQSPRSGGICGPWCRNCETSSTGRVRASFAITLALLFRLPHLSQTVQPQVGTLAVGQATLP